MDVAADEVAGTYSGIEEDAAATKTELEVAAEVDVGSAVDVVSGTRTADP